MHTVLSNESPLTEALKAGKNAEMNIKFWGTRGSIAAPGKNTLRYGGNTCCIEITLESGRTVIVDAGTGMRPLGERYIDRHESADILLLMTHIHWDHIQGFAFFEPIFDRASRIAVDGFPAAMKGLRVIFDDKMGDGFFPVSFDDLKARIDYIGELSRRPVTIGNTRIEAIPLNHPQGALGFRFQEGRKKLVFITDNELVTEGPTGKTLADYVEFCQEADVLIHDAQFSPEEIGRHRGWGHSDGASALNLAVKAHARRLVLFHHAPSRKDEELTAIVEQCRDAAVQDGHPVIIDAAQEGSAFTL